MNGLWWLASYPKSGNTWARIFFQSLTQMPDELDLNALSLGQMSSSREWVEQGLGIDISELSHDEIDDLRPLAYAALSSGASDDQAEATNYFTIHKIHDAYHKVPSGADLIPREAIQGVILIVRNPLDVVVSLANHNRSDIDNAVERICDQNLVLCGTTRSQVSQLRQKQFTWSEHCMSWINAGLPIGIFRYEDLLKDSQAEFSTMCRFVDLSVTEMDIERAAATSSFLNLQLLEAQQGFREKPPGVANFFRKGVVGDWHGKLTDSQIDQIVQVNHEAMSYLGYLDECGKPTITPKPSHLKVGGSKKQITQI